MINNIISHPDLYNSFLTEIYSTPICNCIYYTTDITIFSKHHYFYTGTSVKTSPAIANVLQISQDIITSKSKHVSVTPRRSALFDLGDYLFPKNPAPEVLDKDNKPLFSSNTKNYIYTAILTFILMCLIGWLVYSFHPDTDPAQPIAQGPIIEAIPQGPILLRELMDGPAINVAVVHDGMDQLYALYPELIPKIDGTDAIIDGVRYKDAFTQKPHPINVEISEENFTKMVQEKRFEGPVDELSYQWIMSQLIIDPPKDPYSRLRR